MTDRTFAAIAETVCDKWQASFGQATPSEIFGPDPGGFNAWAVGAVSMKLTRNDLYRLCKAVRERCRGLESAQRMVESPPKAKADDGLGGLFQPGQEG